MTTATLNPPPPRQPALSAGDLDTRYFDLTADLSPLGVTIATIAAITVARADGNPTGASDLTISTTKLPWISTSGLIANWWQSATTAVATDYTITVAVATSDGRTLHYTCCQLVTPAVG